MFQCQQCQSTQFKLQVQAGVSSDIEVTINEHDDVVISVGTQTFVADLSFINRFGVCEGCGAKKQWAYFYPKVSS